MYISNKVNNNTNFERKLKIKIKGDEFKKHPEDKIRVKNAIKENKELNEFFRHRRGSITVTSSSEPFMKEYEYPTCLKKVPSRSLPFDMFEVQDTNYSTYIKVLYGRCEGLKGLFKKPTWVEGGIKAPKGEMNTWKDCIDFTIRLINEKLPETIRNNEKRRLLAEKK